MILPAFPDFRSLPNTQGLMSCCCRPLQVNVRVVLCGFIHGHSCNDGVIFLHDHLSPPGRKPFSNDVITKLPVQVRVIVDHIGVSRELRESKGSSPMETLLNSCFFGLFDLDS